MLQSRDLFDLVENERKDVLSVALDIDPSKPENQATHPAYTIELRNAVRNIIDGLSKSERRAAEETAGPVLSFVESMRPEGRGLAIFAAPDLWRQYFVPFPIPTRVSYGRADVMPLMWTVDEYEPYAILLVDREEVRILTAYLGSTAVLEREVLVLDTSDWRFKAGRQPTYAKAAGVGAGRGAAPDTFAAGRGAAPDAFAARVEDNIRRFWLGAAEAATRWLDDLKIERLIICGPEESTSVVREALPKRMGANVVGVIPMPSYADSAEIEKRTLPVALAEEHRQDSELVATLLEGATARKGGVVGKAATIDALQQGQAKTVVAVRILEGEAWQCRRCKYVLATARQRCSACRGKMEPLPLTQVLPLLTLRGGAEIEVVGEEAGQGLRPHDGLGAILRYEIPAPR